MTTRCNHGDLAIVVHDEPACASNIDQFVEIQGPVSSTSYQSGMVAWRIRQVDSHTPWAVREPDGSITFERLIWKSRVVHPDAWLLPSRPEALEDEEVTTADQHQLDNLVTVGSSAGDGMVMADVEDKDITRHRPCQILPKKRHLSHEHDEHLPPRHPEVLRG